LVGTPPPLDEEDDVELLDEVEVELLLEALPLHDSPQIEVTSLTHMESQRKSQQYGSCPQTCVAQGSQVVVSELPVSQIGCEQPESQRIGYVPLGSEVDGGGTQSYSPSLALQPQTLVPVHVSSLTVVLVGVLQ
jgi:hypothetical protein